MCPACYAATIWMVAGATTAAGVTSVGVVSTIRNKRKKRAAPKVDRKPAKA